MAARLRINYSGVRELLKSPGLVADLTRRGRAIADRAGDGHTVFVENRGRKRARVAVVTTSVDAMKREARERNLLRSLDAARGN